MEILKKIEWVLRIGIAGEFMGHGLLAIGGKNDWISWINQITGVNDLIASKILLIIGVMDVLVALVILFRPIKPILLWAAFWGLWTAFIRPLVGLGWLDFIERFANWSAPLALYYLCIFKAKTRKSQSEYMIKNT